MSVFWITGLPGSGKSTLGFYLKKSLSDLGIPSIVIDGDQIREAFGDLFGYQENDRIQLSKIYVNLARVFESQGLHVIVCTVSLFDEVFFYLADKIPRARVIFIDAEPALLRQRDQKKLYSLGEKNIPGVSLLVAYPKNPFMILRGDETHEELQTILNRLAEIIENE